MAERRQAASRLRPTRPCPDTPASAESASCAKYQASNARPSLNSSATSDSRLAPPPLVPTSLDPHFRRRTRPARLIYESHAITPPRMISVGSQLPANPPAIISASLTGKKSTHSAEPGGRRVRPNGGCGHFPPGAEAQTRRHRVPEGDHHAEAHPSRHHDVLARRRRHRNNSRNDG